MIITGQGVVQANQQGLCFVPKEEIHYNGSVYVPNMRYWLRGNVRSEFWFEVHRWANEGKVEFKEH